MWYDCVKRELAQNLCYANADRGCVLRRQNRRWWRREERYGCEKEKAKQTKDTKTQDVPQEATAGSSEKVRAASVSPKIDIFRAEIHEHDIGLPHKVWFIPSDHPIVCLSLVFEDAGAKNVNATHPSLPMFLWPMLLRGQDVTTPMI